MRALTTKLLSFSANKLAPACFLNMAILASIAQAAPQNGVVVGGSPVGTITNSGLNTNIVQHQNSMVIDWQSFNVGAKESVNFQQPSTSAAALNRIHDQNPSQVFGAINANGRVFLANPNGIIFGKTATVNVGALFATGLSISDEDFLQGNYRFTAEGYTPGAIINRGLLRAAAGGSISLVGGR
ncbi:MAG TPA: filamentous hemagglutinin N-terminal domain-containing protein, partial [Thiotrichales bacterium]|nr:filamentous hemagglutinin N-terminal domain-containing protein [Thiotrichales bacterium]